jgi:hypothetical protein
VSGSWRSRGVGIGGGGTLPDYLGGGGFRDILAYSSREGRLSGTTDSSLRTGVVEAIGWGGLDDVTY